MSNENKNSSGGGIGIAGLLGIVFIVLRLCEVISWSWWWVLSPFWIPVALIVVGAIVMTLIDKK